MFVYCSFFLVIAILAINYEFNKSKELYLLGSIAILLALLAGFRHSSVARDYTAYLYSFELVYPNDSIYKFAIYEPGFVLIVDIVRSIVQYNYAIVIMLVYAFSSVLLKVSAIRKLAINPYLVILFYFSHFFILHEMIQIRIGLAAAIFFISTGYYFKGNIKAFITLIVIASLFHYSAIFYLLTLFLKKDVFNRYLYASMIFAAIVLAFIKIPLIGFLNTLEYTEATTKVENYTVAAEFAVEKVKVLNVVTVLNIMCCLYLLVAVPPDGFLQDKKLAFFLKCNIISIFLLAFFSGIPSIAFRMSDLFGIFSMFVFAYLARYLPFGRYNIFITILVAGAFFYFFAINSTLINAYRLADF